MNRNRPCQAALCDYCESPAEILFFDEDEETPAKHWLCKECFVRKYPGLQEKHVKFFKSKEALEEACQRLRTFELN